MLFREALIRVRVDRTFAQFDAAILDVTIRGGQVFPVAEILIGRRLPFVFASGYGDWALPEAFRGRPRLEKPFTSDEVEAALHGLLRGRTTKRQRPLVSAALGAAASGVIQSCSPNPCKASGREMAAAGAPRFKSVRAAPP